jgi:hypothetical protein
VRVQKEQGMSVFEAKFPGRCRDCGGHMPAGTRIDWERGRGARHAGECPAAVAEEPSLPLVPDGRYAVQIEGEWHLFRVWRGTRDPSVQHVYAVRGTEDGTRIRDERERAAVLAVAENPGEAAVQFGHRTGCCSRCGAELDVNLARFCGIGGTCMKHWFSDEVRFEKLRAGREALRAVGLEPTEKFDDISAAVAWATGGDVEAAMARIEADADRAQTEREEAAKWEARRVAEMQAKLEHDAPYLTTAAILRYS